MTGRHAAILAVAIVLMTTCAGCEAPAPAASAKAAAQAPASSENHAALEARIKALEALLPSQSHMMADVGDHFANLWFAGTAENWPLADFYLAETQSHLHWAVRRIPVRKDNKGRDINLMGILEAFENSQLKELKKTIDGRDAAGFQRMYRESLTMCYSCHKAADKPYLKPRIPIEPPSRIINFDPKADWPL
ncbi:MAG: hypothetical protein ACYC61_02270 [Isosphaeraceae bacterium]